MEKPGNTLLRVFYCHWKRLKLNGCVIGTFNSEMKIKMGLMPAYTTFVVLKEKSIDQKIYLRLPHDW